MIDTVIKKNPLVVPPDFEKMPLPKNDNDNMNSFKAESEQDNEFKKLLEIKEKKTGASTSKEKTDDIEKKIIDKIQ